MQSSPISQQSPFGLNWLQALAQSLQKLFAPSSASPAPSAPPSSPQTVYGYPMRAPYQGEQLYFLNNPHVAGMATDDRRITLNPFAALTDPERQAVARNEAARLYLRDVQAQPDFALTPEQQLLFGDTLYGQPEHEMALKHTILARLLSNDPSAGIPTPHQQEWADWLRHSLEGR